MLLDSAESRALAANVASIAESLAGRAGIIDIPLGDFVLSTGVVLAVFADGASATPGTAIVDSKARAIRWNNHASPTAVMAGFALPQDVKADSDISVRALVSKTGATVGDATTLTVGLYFQTPGALHDADADAGGATGAVVGDAAAKTLTELSRAIAHADVPDAPGSATISIKPTDGTLGTDDLCLHRVWVEYTRKVVVGA